MDELYGDPHGQHVLDAMEERLHDHAQTPVDEAAAFRVDFPDWLGQQSERDRQIIGAMIRDERTRDLARTFGVSPGRVSQWRREYEQDWQRFHGEAPVDEPQADNGAP
jgi:FixJ family two-component response regulator